MSPLSKMVRGQAGKLEITQLQATDSVQVCVEFEGRSISDAYFIDGKTRQRFYVLSLDGILSANIGLYKGEGWYRWVWMWESKDEADKAWSKSPSDIEETLDRLAQRINDFIKGANRNAKSTKSLVVLDITPELKSIGWPMTILGNTTDEAAREYKLSKRTREKKKE
jgi:hypothetical protein